MMNSLKLPRRVVALAGVLALMLLFATTGLANAAPAKSQDVTPPSSNCLSANPAFQTVIVSQPAKLTITVTCPLPPQPVANASVVVAWGDGSSSTYVYCMEVCYASISASHTYTAVGDYSPSICLVAPTSTSSTPEVIACTSVKIKVLVPPVS
jgi:hypothetical protein